MGLPSSIVRIQCRRRNRLGIPDHHLGISAIVPRFVPLIIHPIPVRSVLFNWLAAQTSALKFFQPFSISLELPFNGDLSRSLSILAICPSVLTTTSFFSNLPPTETSMFSPPIRSLGVQPQAVFNTTTLA